MTSRSSSSSEHDDSAFPHQMASSLAGLPVRPQPTNGQPAAAPPPAQGAGLKDFLDLATTRGSSQADIAARLEQKRLEHERQRELQKAAFEEQMRQLELQQEQEERDLLERGEGADGKPTAPVRSRSGNDLAKFTGETASAAPGPTIAGAKSMPGSRRHSGEVVAEGDEKVVVGKDGQSHLNSFLFDDELDHDLHNSAWGGKYLAINGSDKFPTLPRAPGARAGASEWPQFAPNGRAVAQDSKLAAIGTNNGERLRSATHDNSAPATPSADVRGSPIGRAGSQLPLPRVGAQTASGRSSPSVDKKVGGAKPFGSDLGALGSGAGYPGVDGLSEQFSNFNIDSKAFGGYGQDAFTYDSSAGQYGTMGANRFAGLRLEDLQGEMLPLCKDQFGCRYLQKKLEDGNPEHRDLIFNEIFPHFAELMTDPFANYLSQRLLEYSTDEQKDALIESIAGELVSISLNMHGTRAVQKMIDYLSTQRQVQSLILALNLNVVTLIKDLNGNHVIQKCLNHLPPEDNQFIYNAVATHCIEVATHRHGCCVLQRCIDHASESQRIQLVTEITYNSLTLVQDAFGNYVVQYVLDLNDNRFIEAIVRQFLGNVAALSAQKFSSNVVEKCIRVADPTGRRAIIDELVNKQRLERLLRDSYGNYVAQTALDYAELPQRQQLIEVIQPILPSIRNTPYGKRIQSKLQRETRGYNGGHHGGPGFGHFGGPGHFYGYHQGPPGGGQFMGHHGHPGQFDGYNHHPNHRNGSPYGAFPGQHQHHQPPHQQHPMHHPQQQQQPLGPQAQGQGQQPQPQQQHNFPVGGGEFGPGFNGVY